MNGTPWYTQLQNPWFMNQGNQLEDHNSSDFEKQLPGLIYQAGQIGSQFISAYKQGHPSISSTTTPTTIDNSPSKINVDNLITIDNSPSKVLVDNFSTPTPQSISTSAGSFGTSYIPRISSTLASLSNPVQVNSNPLTSNVETITADSIDTSAWSTRGNQSSGSSIGSQMGTAAVGAGTKMALNYGLGQTFGAMGMNKTKGGQFASGILQEGLSTMGATVASNLMTGSSALSGLGSAANIGGGAMAATNIALDVFDPVRKSKAETYTTAGIGAGSLAGILAGSAAAGPIGWAAGASILAANVIGHATGKKTQSYKMDEDMYSELGNSYAGSMRDDMMSAANAGQKYSGYNAGARHKMDEWIIQSKVRDRLLNVMAKENQDNRTLSGTMNTTNTIDYENKRRGVIGPVFAAKHGSKLIFENLYKAREIVNSIKYKKSGGKITDSYTQFINSFPKGSEGLYNTSDFRMKDYWEFNGRPKDFDEAISKGMFTQHKDGWHAKSVAENPKTGEIEYMKSSNHPTRYMESDWYEKGLVYDEDENGNIISIKLSPGVDGYDDWLNFTKNYELQKTEPYWKYVKRKGTDQPQSFKEGGSLTKSDWLVEVEVNNIPFEFRGEDIEEVELDSILPEFKEGGKFNLIPEGALHARKHNMDVEGITPKGIPVVSEAEGGELEQQAEIEREEIIFRLEVTKKIEELAKDGSDEAAIEAGKLLVEEILYNTIDNTNSLI